MENNSSEKQLKIVMVEERQPLLESSPTPKGGLRTLPFIAGNLALTTLVTYALTPNMILYLMREYQMDMASGSNVLFWWNAASNITPVIGAFVADSFVGRFQMIGTGSVICLLGMFLFWLTTIIPQARPPPCSESNDTCGPATMLQLCYLFSSFILVSIGCGGVRSSSLAFCVDQLKNIQKNAGEMERYMGWYYALTIVSVLVAMTCLVYIQENMGWEIGFGILVVIMLCATILIFMGFPFYMKSKSKGSLITGLIRVIVASYRKRSLVLSSLGNRAIAYHQEGTVLRLPSETLRFLNKACIIQDPQQDLNLDGKAADPWSLCTVDQVEELKAILKVVPIWITGVIMNVNVSQGAFDTVQATSVDRHIGSSFEIPAGSLGIFTFSSVILWLALYDRAIIPIVSRIARKPVHFGTKARMGCGIFVSLLAVVVGAVVETIRRSLAIESGYSENPEGIVNMSVLWLVPRLLLVGFAEAMNAVAQNEFYISEFPESMWSIASNLLGLGLAAASMLASFLMSAIDNVTSGGGESESWISSNINKGHYDYYNWILAGLSTVNLLLFYFCSHAYGPCQGEMNLKAVVEAESP